MKVKKHQLEPYMEQQTGSKLEKEYNKAVYCHPAYLTSMQTTSCKMPGWVNHELESRLLGQYQWPQICRWYHSSGKKWRGTKAPLDQGERGDWKSVLKAQHKTNKIRASVPINPWQIEGGKVEAVTDLIFLDSIPETLWTMTAARKLKVAYSWEGKQWQT